MTDLIRSEISKRLRTARTSDPVTRHRHLLELELVKAAGSITAMIEASEEPDPCPRRTRHRWPARQDRGCAVRRTLIFWSARKRWQHE
jgi:hypothetical protein